ncbi:MULTISPECIES: hypothetical protein [unclassified Haladaptatus]|uniref:hypothetical protein n=1 Tax=unclassified Haladaptatus TaxID=2622732 RepID=UPI00209C4094|nr:MULTISPECIES: hypothetical protein [unclassified Haladaptatus]MCO8244038.1 hypothetical protein [Haladaptatus sp. AB643]MCO8255843.1 hypothetical protein [Haladaptatus sp. AB618]
MSTRSLQGIGTTRTTTTTESSSPYLNKILQLMGLFFFINGIYVAFFSDNIFTAFGYYFVVIAAICAILSRAISPEEPLISKETQRKVRQLAGGSTSTQTRRSGRQRSGRQSEFDVRRYLRKVVKAVERIDVGGSTSRGNGRDRL